MHRAEADVNRALAWNRLGSAVDGLGKTFNAVMLSEYRELGVHEVKKFGFGASDYVSCAPQGVIKIESQCGDHVFRRARG